MRIEDISVPEVYKESQDFRFFLKWFEIALSKIQNDTENLVDIYDPLRCPSNLLWLLSDTMGFKFDSRLCPAFNRLVLVYFMSMIYNRGSKTGMILAAEVNLAQFSIEKYGSEKDILFDRLEDTSIPVNSVTVTPNVEEGYIDVVYLSTRKPVDACIEYVRPLGMYLFEHSGVSIDAKTKVSVDARLTNTDDMYLNIGPTHVGHYRRDDYASMQHMEDEMSQDIDPNHTRHPSYYRNSEYEQDPEVNSGYRTLYSLQMSNNEHIVDALLVDEDNKPIFGVGHRPITQDDVTLDYPDDYFTEEYRNSDEFKKGEWKEDYSKPYNLQYDKGVEHPEGTDPDVYTSEEGSTELDPIPKVDDKME